MAKGVNKFAEKETELEKAKRVIKEGQEIRSKSCSDEINKVLEKHNCQIVPTGQFQGNQIKVDLNIVCKE